MSISELGSLGEFIGSLLVLATLLFLSLQMRQNTNAMNASMAADITAHFIANTHLMINNSELAELFIKTQFKGEWDSLDAKDFVKLINYSMATLKSGDFAHYQWSKGNLDDDLWMGTAETLIQGFSLPNHPWVKTWEVTKNFYTPKFQAYIESIQPAETPYGSV
jgi:hypothetical protein